MNSSPTSQATSNATPTGTPISAGAKVKSFEPKGRPTVWSTEDMEPFVKLFNAFCGMTVTRQEASTGVFGSDNVDSGKFVFSNEKVLLALKDRIVNTDVFFPFRIYQVPAQFCPPADPVTGYDPNVDSWRTFQIRLGYCSYRSAYSYTPGFSSEYGNQQYTVLAGTDGNTNTTEKNYSAIPFGASPIDVIYVPDTGIAEPSSGTAPSIWIMNKLGDVDFSQCLMAFWIEWVDTLSPQAFYPIIKAQMFANTLDPSGRTDVPFPTNPNIIPIGYVYTPSNGGNDGTPTARAASVIKASKTVQYLATNLIDRYSPPVSASPYGPVMFRGYWNSSDIFTPLAGQLFYAGDMVTVINDDDNNYYTLIFIYSAPFFITDTPTSDEVYWEEVAKYIEATP